MINQLWLGLKKNTDILIRHYQAPSKKACALIPTNPLWSLAWFACLSIPDTTPLGQHCTPSHHDERHPDTTNARHLATLVIASSLLVLMLIVHRKGFRVLVLVPLEATEGRPPPLKLPHGPTHAALIKCTFTQSLQSPQWACNISHLCCRLCTFIDGLLQFRF